MKTKLRLIILLTGVVAGGPLMAAAQARSDAELPSAQVKIKSKDGRTVVRDKLKPVRKAIEQWYARNAEAFRAKNVAAVMALRTDDFHTLTPDGKINRRTDMEAYTRRFLGMIDHFLSLDFEIGALDVQGELASADVRQDTVRMQRLPDGTLHKVQSLAVQRETWKQTAAGWMLYKVDNIRDLGIFVDGKPYKP